MVINERKEVIHKEVKDIPIGRVCDCCGKKIEPVRFSPYVNEYNYFVVHTYHHDWGNDSIDSHDYYDACSPECAVSMANLYLTKSYGGTNTNIIEIAHTRSLSDGTDRTYPHKIDEWM